MRRYNLKLIEDRDEELYRYEETLSHLKGVVQEKEVAVSEMKMKVADVEQALEKEVAKRKDQQNFYTDKIKGLNLSLEQSHSTRENQERTLRKEVDAAKRELEAEVATKEEQLEHLRLELTESFDKILKEKLVAAGKERDEEHAKLRAAEQSLAGMQQKLQISSLREEELKQRIMELEKTEETLKKSEKKLSWALEDERRLAQAKLEDLDNEKTEAVASKKKLLDEYEGKMSELLKALHTVERAFTMQKEGYEKKIKEMDETKALETTDLVKSLTSKLADITQQLSETERELSSLRSTYKNATADMKLQVENKSREIGKLQEALRESREEASVARSPASQGAVNAQVQTLSTQLAEVSKELENMHAKYKKSLEAAESEHNLKMRELLHGKQQVEVENKRLEAELNELMNSQRRQNEKPGRRGQKEETEMLDLDIAHVSPIRVETSHYNFLEDLEQKETELAALKKENSTLADAMRRMREELESLQTPSQTINEEFIEERNGLLKQVEKMRKYTAVLQGAVDFDDSAEYYKTEVTMLRDLCDTLTEQLNESRKRLFTVSRIGSRQSGTALEGAEDVNKTRELERTKADLAKILKERDKLIELTNQLKAKGEREEDNERFEKIVKITEKQVSAAYQKKIDAVEEALETLVLQNRELKQKLKGPPQRAGASVTSSRRVKTPTVRPKFSTKQAVEADGAIAAKVQTLRQRLAAKDIIPSDVPRHEKTNYTSRRGVKPKERKKVRNYNITDDG